MINERRRLDDDQRRVSKSIQVVESDGEHHYAESVRLYSHAEVTAMLRAAGLYPIVEPWGDYSGGAMNPSHPRAIYFAEKRD